MMPTLTLTSANIGTVLASNGTLTSVRFTAPPPSTVYGGGTNPVFQLVDKHLPERAPGWPVPKQIVCIDVTTNMIPSTSSGSAMFPKNALLNSLVPFANLIMTQCPEGAAFQIDIA
jgi:hypothetical protein